MSDVSVSTQPMPMAIYEATIQMIRRAKIKRAYLLLFLPTGPATLAISRANFLALQGRGVPVITKDEARGVLRPISVRV